jgi:1-acyl-sn-glycerol-3-phosphate acyltransferase
LSASHTLRAWLRLLRVLGSVFRGTLVCAFLFPFMKPAQRMAQVRLFSQRMLRSLGLRLVVTGTPHAGPVMLAANHVSWLDIIAIDAVAPARFVSKSDIRAWPLIGWMVACGGTLFIERERKRDAMRVVHQVAAALQNGETLAVFPEGTTSDGHGLLPFHANLLQAAVATGAPAQPIALRYSESRHVVSPAAAFVGETTLAQSLWWTVRARDLHVDVMLLDALPTAQVDRRVLAVALRQAIQDRLDLGVEPV